MPARASGCKTPNVRGDHPRRSSTFPVGASLLAKALDQSPSMLDVPTSSRAGSLPQVGWA
ncbi:hypothetical protein C1X35_09385 [Pseudomonas sp. FW306-1C-G01A]|nr:hypothetical protein C1X56_23090 [Pseudomonas sp. GW101-1A09]PMV98505.1 hypothetical protein C1X50_30970 [Pseudomonas sp. MPR-TSA4]PMV98782.1 hypothetical protein C1X51_02170 [Pseudomonas sp. FW306-2-2C-B10A]PMW11262.1 hypothetical protein C1X52_21675 [Pseudomonas sp. FW306-2-1A-C05A]PMW11525.1 hypothetical protein C1X40_28220 [Pseudomonas sp. GW456-11-11-14-TSB2]PMW24732.1 hypothetical protein C1X53_09115 [Pseudomonas sp. GW456-E6]PMW32985.1 hypothetical protein C1X45_22040 [Pseudomonas s